MGLFSCWVWLLQASWSKATNHSYVLVQLWWASCLWVTGLGGEICGVVPVAAETVVSRILPGSSLPETRYHFCFWLVGMDTCIWDNLTSFRTRWVCRAAHGQLFYCGQLILMCICHWRSFVSTWYYLDQGAIWAIWLWRASDIKSYLCLKGISISD